MRKKLDPDITAPVKAGQKIGEVSLYRDKDKLTTINLIAEKGIEKAGMMKQITRTIQGVFGL